MWTLTREEFTENFDPPSWEAVEGQLHKLGRTAEVKCVSPVISRNHCQIQFRNGLWYIQDLGSLNGTFVNEDKLDPNTWTLISHNDRVGLGAGTVPEDLEEGQQQQDFFIFRFINLNHRAARPPTPPPPRVQEEVIVLSDSDDEDEVIPPPPVTKPSPPPVAKPSPKRFKESPVKPGPASSKQKHNVISPEKKKSPKSSSSKSIPKSAPEKKERPISSSNSIPKLSNDKVISPKQSPASSSNDRGKTLCRPGPQSWKKAQARKEKDLENRSIKRPGQQTSHDKGKSHKRPKLVPHKTRKLPSSSEESDNDDDVIPIQRVPIVPDKQVTKMDGSALRTGVKKSELPSSSSGRSKGQGTRKSSSSHPKLRWCDGEKMDELVIRLARAVAFSKYGFKWDALIIKQIERKTMERVELQLQASKKSVDQKSKTSVMEREEEKPVSLSKSSTNGPECSLNPDELINTSNISDTEETNFTSHVPETVMIEKTSTKRTYPDDSEESSHAEENVDISDDEPRTWLDEDMEEEIPEALPPTISSSKIQEPRKMQFLEHPPTPRQHRLKPNNNQANNNQLKRGTSRSAPQIPLKERRKEKLRKLAENKLTMKTSEATTTTTQSSAEVPKVKVTARSRNDGFIADLLGKQPEEPPSSRANTIPEEVRNQMPMQRIIQRMPVPESAAIAKTLPDNSNRINVPTHNGLPTVNTTMKEILQKTNAVASALAIREGIPAQTKKTEVTVDKSNINSHSYGPSTSSNVPTNKSELSRDSKIDAVQPYRDVLKWNARWLEEQATAKRPPPVVGNTVLMSTLTEYTKYTDYTGIMYPLLLMELWASIYADYSGERSGPRQAANRSDRNKPTTMLQELEVGIEAVEQVSVCPFLMNRTVKNKMAPKLNSTVKPEGSNNEWTQIMCHAAFTDDNTSLDRVNDLAVVTLHFKGTDNEELVHRKVFTFVQLLGDPIIVDKTTNVHKALYTKASSPKKKQNFFLTCMLNQSEVTRISLETPAQLKKISYISSKLRDFKSVLTLSESCLFERVLQPRLDAPIFSSAKVPDPSKLISKLNTSLNASQKTVIHAISERVLRNNEPDVMLLHGPPGTGKTSVIIGLISQLVISNKTKENRPRILVCTPSNTAIDEILIRLDKFFAQNYKDENPIIIRVGNEDSARTKKFNLDVVAKKRWEESTPIESLDKEISNSEKEFKLFNFQIEERRKKQEDAKTLIDQRVILRQKLTALKQQKADFLRKSQQPNMELARQRLIQQADVICSTLSSCNNGFMKKLLGRVRNSMMSNHDRPKFTCCIVDEATQCTEPESLAPLMLDVNKLILVGDPLQLPATVLSLEAMKRDFGQSLFTRHYNVYKREFKNKPSPVMFLELQYRMHPEILKFPNDFFYDGMLKSAKAVLDRVNCAKIKPYVFINVSGTESVNGGKVSNEQEVHVILEILKTIQFQKNIVPASKDFSPSIGIITPYREQKFDIRRAINEKDVLNYQFATGIEVDTVDGFQGREKDIIVLSCVRTKSIGFLTSRHRLNVALTRAKQSLIIVGDAELLNTNDMWKNLMDDATKRGLYLKVPNDLITKLKVDGLRHAIEKIILV